MLDEELTPLYIRGIRRFLLKELGHIDSDLVDECVAAVYHAAKEQVEDDSELDAVTRQVKRELMGCIRRVTSFALPRLLS